MIGFLVVTHGEMAPGLIDGLEMIVGRQAQCETLTLGPGDAVDALKAKVEDAIARLDSGDGVLVFVDVLGASPFNVSAEAAWEEPTVDVISGVNLPMLLEAAMVRDSLSLPELAALARDSGQSGIRLLSESV